MSNSEHKRAEKESSPPREIVRERQKEERASRVQRSSLGGLQYIATGMNTYNGQYSTADGEWEIVEAILKAKSLPQRMHLFEEHAKRYPVCLTVRETDKSRLPKPSLSSNEPQGDVLKQLWWSYFRDEGWRRLKRCLQCQDWFVDSTRNKSAVRCSVGCNSLWWSRDRRKKANHKHQKIEGGLYGTEKRKG